MYAAVIALATLQVAAAYPVRWTQKITSNNLACSAHPADHSALSYTGHGFPKPLGLDPAIVFTVSDPTALHGAALALPLCLQSGQESGATFDVQVCTVDMTWLYSRHMISVQHEAACPASSRMLP